MEQDDGFLLAIARTGLIKISSFLTVYNMLHVLNLSCNLLSISKLTQNYNFAINFYLSRCEFQEIVGSAKECRGLYFEDGTNSNQQVQGALI